jgi:hypothetical protein
VGQVINVTTAPSIDPSVRKFVMDRSLTGMGLREFWTPEDAAQHEPADTLAAHLFALPGVATVFVNGSVVTVTAVDAATWSELETQAVDVIRNLFVHYDVNRV